VSNGTSWVEYTSSLVQNVLRTEDWICEPEILNSGAHFISTLFGTDDGSFNAFIVVPPNGNELRVVSVLSEKVPPQFRGVMLEFINKYNDRSNAGCLMIDMKDGEISLRTEIFFEDNTPIVTPATVRALIFGNCSMMSDVMVAVRRVVFGGQHPALALSQLVQQEIEPASMPLSHGAPSLGIPAPAPSPVMAAPYYPGQVATTGSLLPPPPPPPPASPPPPEDSRKCSKCGGALVLLPRQGKFFCGKCSELAP